MAWNLGGGSSKSSNSSVFNENVWAPHGSAMTGLWDSAQGLYGGQNFGMYDTLAQNLTPWMIQQAQMTQPAYQQQLSGGIQDPQMTANLNNFLSSPSATQDIYQSVLGGEGQTYADPLVNQLRQDMQIKMDRGPMKQQGVGYANLGRPGSDRNTLQNALLEGENNRNFGLMSAGIRHGAQADDLAMQMKIAEQADANKLAGLQLGFNNLNQQNANQQGAFGLGQGAQNLMMGGFAPYMMAQNQPWNMMGNWANMLQMQPTVLGSGSSSGKSSGWNFGGGAGGM